MAEPKWSSDFWSKYPCYAKYREKLLQFNLPAIKNITQTYESYKNIEQCRKYLFEELQSYYELSPEVMFSLMDYCKNYKTGDFVLDDYIHNNKVFHKKWERSGLT
mgnify:CR=1 FL=1